MSFLISNRTVYVFLFSSILFFMCLSSLHAQENGGYEEYPVDLSSKGPLGYILVQFVYSDDSSQVEAVGDWLKDVELPYVFKHTNVNQATIYKTTYSPEEEIGEGREQPDYYVIYRFYAVDAYAQTRDQISYRLNKVLKKAPYFLLNEKVLFYQEHNRIRRMTPHDSAYNGLLDPNQSQPKYADYGFSQASLEGIYCNSLDPGDIEAEDQWTYITWYQSVRQHDVVGKYGPYDSARMWLLVPGQDYPNYILTMYEYSPAEGELATLRDLWNYYYGKINEKDMDLLDEEIYPNTPPGAEGFKYYCTGPRGGLKIVYELFKNR